jgi:predicted nucleic acid-binding protein
VTSARRPFLDTNILIYAFSTDARQPIARALLEKGGVISVQCLNEFVNVTRRTVNLPWSRIHQTLTAIKTLSTDVLGIDAATQAHAVHLAERHGFHIYDATIVASALDGGCDFLLSEDMHHGLVVEDRLRIENPFRAA